MVYFLIILFKFVWIFPFLAQKIHLNSPKNCIFSLKKIFEPQYFTLRTLEKYGNFSVKNVLKISPKLRLSVLINFVLIKKKECIHYHE